MVSMNKITKSFKDMFGKRYKEPEVTVEKNPDEPLISKLTVHFTDKYTLTWTIENATKDSWSDFVNWFMKTQDPYYMIEHNCGSTMLKRSTIVRFEITWNKPLDDIQ